MPKHPHRSALLALLACVSLCDAARSATVFTMSNDSNANAVLAFYQSAAGTLSPRGTFQTGGRGTGGLLGNQGGVALSSDGRFLFVVNAGSDSVSVFRVDDAQPVLQATVASGGHMPNSVAVRGSRVYVLNAGNDVIAGFTLGSDGSLAPVAGVPAALSGSNTGAAQIGFSADGNWLIATERYTDKIDIFPVQSDGTLGAANVAASAGAEPFGFVVAQNGTLVVVETHSDANRAGTVSSYRIGTGGALQPVSSRVPTHQTASCWIAMAPDGHNVYTTNTLSGTVSQFSLGTDGAVSLVPANGVSAKAKGGRLPLDAAIDPDGKYLYTVDFSTPGISIFAIAADGSLRASGARKNGVPGSANGIVVR